MASAPPRKKPVRPLWATAQYEPADVGAIKAVGRGDATPEQQRRALDWIIRQACQTYEEQFDPDSARVTDFLLGRRSVGQQIIKLFNMPSTHPENRENG